MEELDFLVNTAGLSVAYDAENDWLYTRMCGWHDLASMQISAYQVYNCLQERPCTKMLSDHSELLGNWNGAVPYLRPWYFERLAAQGVTHLAWVYAKGYYYNEFGDERKIPSSGWLGAENSFLTVHTTALPVPEPSTWMMLLGGLLLPWVVSRRQRARAA